MAVRDAPLVGPLMRLLRGLRMPQRRPPTACPRCATPVRAALPACPLCGEVMPVALDRPLERWRRRGLLEITVIAVVLVVFLVCFLVVFAHR
jgi:hypothetical protein